MQDLAISLIPEPFGIRTAAQVEALFTDWKAANPGKTVLYGSGVLLKYASRLVEEGRLKDGNVIGQPNTAGNGGGQRSNGRAGKSGDDTGIDWNASAKAAEDAWASKLSICAGWGY